MFDKSVIETRNFLHISLTAKALYFLLGMEADDEGFVDPERVLRLYGGEYGDIKNLADTGLIIPFQSGVVVITDWNENNWLDSRRIKPTRYQEEKKMLTLTKDKMYVLSSSLALAKTEENRGEENRGEEIVSVKTDDNFSIFWSKYPKKELKKKAQDIWIRKKLSSKLNEILDFIEKAKETDRWIAGYIKQPTAFLNGECWNDDLNSYQDRKKLKENKTIII